MVVMVAAIMSQATAFGGPRNMISRAARMQTIALRDAPRYEIVPMEKENVENAASVTSGIVGFLVLGPFGGIIAAALANWAVKKDNDGGEALRGVGTAVVNAYNYITKINSNYELSTKVTSTVSELVEGSAPEAKTKIDETLGKVSAIVSEYDLVTKGKALAKASADLSEVALEKLDELNTKYDFVESGKKLAAGATEAATKAIDANRSN